MSDMGYRFTRPRKLFLCKTYVVVLVCTIISLIVWLVVLLDEDNAKKFFEKNYLACICCLGAAMLCIGLMIMFSALNVTSGVNTFFGVLVACLVLFGSLAIVSNATIVEFAISFAVAVLVAILCILIAFLCRCDFTAYIIYMFSLMLIGAVAAFFLIIKKSSINSDEGGLIEMILLLFLIMIIVLLMVFTAQAMQGGVYIEVDGMSYTKSGCCFYLHYVVLFIMILNFFFFIKNYKDKKNK